MTNNYSDLRSGVSEIVTAKRSEPVTAPLLPVLEDQVKASYELAEASARLASMMGLQEIGAPMPEYTGGPAALVARLAFNQQQIKSNLQKVQSMLFG